MEFNYTISKKEGYAVIDMSGNLIDKNLATPLLDEIQTVIDGGTKNFVISMENFKYLNSNGLNVLVNILTKSRKNGGDTTVCSLNNKIKELLIITKLEQYDYAGATAIAVPVTFTVTTTSCTTALSW